MFIGNIELKYGLLMAPVAGYTNSAFRKIVFEFGCELAFTEMVSVKSFINKNLKTGKIIKKLPGEKLTGIQFFGSEPDDFTKAVSIVNENEFQIIDINLGCPVPKVIKANAGVALMKDLKRTEKILKSCTKNSHFPVTVKMRTGWSKKNKNCIELAKLAEQSGVSAVIIHGRTKEDMFRTPIDYTTIAKLKKEVSIPVIANGGVESFEDFIKMKKETDCDAVMIGRGTLKKPWIFRDIIAGIDGNQIPAFKPEQITDTIRKHFLYMVELYNERTALLQFRKAGVYYLKGFKYAGSMRERMVRIENYNDLQEILDSILGRR